MCVDLTKKIGLDNKKYPLPDITGFKLSSSRLSYIFSSRSLIPHSPLIREFRVIAFSWKFTDKFSTILSSSLLPLLKFKSNLSMKKKNFVRNDRRSSNVHNEIMGYLVAASVVLPTITIICPGPTVVILPI